MCAYEKAGAAIRLESRPPAMRFKKSERRESVPQRSLRRCLASRGLFQRDGLTRFGLPSCLKVLLVEDLLHQISGSLASANWPKPGSMEARLELRIWLKVSLFLHDVSFRTTAWFLASFFLLYIVRCVAIVLFFLFFVLLLFFCCAFTIRTSVCVWHAAIVISIVKSSGYLEENVITVPA